MTASTNSVRIGVRRQTIWCAAFGAMLVAAIPLAVRKRRASSSQCDLGSWSTVRGVCSKVRWWSLKTIG